MSWSASRTLSQRFQRGMPLRLMLLVFGLALFALGITGSSLPAVLIGSGVVAVELAVFVLVVVFTRQEHRRQLDTGVLQTLPLTYYPVGMSADRTPLTAPRGYRADERFGELGTGSATFERAAHAVMRWEVKTRSGFRVIRVGAQGSFASDEQVARGECAVIRFGPIRETVEVVRVVDQPRRRGFAYGTLPEHPLRGEEAFIVEWRDDDRVELIVRSFSRPNAAIWWLLWPALAIAREVFLRRYLRVLVE